MSPTSQIYNVLVRLEKTTQKRGRVDGNWTFNALIFHGHGDALIQILFLSQLQHMIELKDETSTPEQFTF